LKEEWKDLTPKVWAIDKAWRRQFLYTQITISSKYSSKSLIVIILKIKLQPLLNAIGAIS
jgi:hypothetical protein